MTKHTSKNIPLLLVILDGWGVALPSKGNAISRARTPNMDRLVRMYPATTLHACGPAVGLHFGEAGNSEVGHSNIGTGRVTYQPSTKITRAISDGSFFRNPELTQAMERCRAGKSSGKSPALHLMGVLSDAGVHGSIDHLFALLVMAKQFEISEVYVHAFLDGRDSAYNSGVDFIKKLEEYMRMLGVGRIATISGRFYAMDRDNHWGRIEKAYQAIVNGKSPHYAPDAVSAVEQSYERGVYDEEFEPTVLITPEQRPVATLASRDSLIFANHRADRARQLTKALCLQEFSAFKRTGFPQDLVFVTMGEYEHDLPVRVAFGHEHFEKTLGEVLSQNGLRQLRIAETEKYAHVTYFFNGNKEDAFSLEDRVIIPSCNVSSYNEKPEMCVKEIKNRAVKEILSNRYDVVIVNFASPDMVSHTGDIQATIEAIETVDKAIGDLSEVVLSQHGCLVITGDHGNAEEMLNERTGVMDKEHSTNPVPLVIVSEKLEGKSLFSKDTIGADLSLIQPQGVLSDIAPTILSLLDIPKPDEMTGISLL